MRVSREREKRKGWKRMGEIRMTKSQQKAYAKYTGVEQLRMIGRSIFFAVRDSLGNIEGFVTIGPNGKTEEDHI